MLYLTLGKGGGGGGHGHGGGGGGHHGGRRRWHGGGGVWDVGPSWADYYILETGSICPDGTRPTVRVTDGALICPYLP